MYLIDTNIFLEILLKQERSEECKTFLYKLVSGALTAVITDFSIDSIVIKLEAESKSSEDIRTFLKSLLYYKGLKIHSMSLEEKILATVLMKKYLIDFDDAIQAQAALSNGIREIVSFDEDFDAITEIKRIEPKNA